MLEEKHRIVAESYSGPRLVSVTARRNGLSASQLFTWRRLAREGRLVEADETTVFAPAIIRGENPGGQSDVGAGTCRRRGERAISALSDYGIRPDRDRADARASSTLVSMRRRFAGFSMCWSAHDPTSAGGAGLARDRP